MWCHSVIMGHVGLGRHLYRGTYPSQIERSHRFTSQVESEACAPAWQAATSGRGLCAPRLFRAEVTDRGVTLSDAVGEHEPEEMRDERPYSGQLQG
jgi:hypothetical protein